MIKLAIFATHPIQYQVPWFRKLSKEKGIDLTVYYKLLPDSNLQGKDFGINFQWDIPLLDGYDWKLLLSNCSSSKKRKYFYNKLEIIRKLSKFNADVAIITGWHDIILWLVLLFCIWRRIPRIVRGESNIMYKRPYYIECLHRMLVSKFNAFLAIGKANRAFYLNYGVKRQFIFSSPYCIDNQRFLSQYENVIGRRNQIRSELNVPLETICFLYVGKLSKKKRIVDLLKALRLLCKSISGAYLLVVGTGELMRQARQLVTEYNLPVTFAGFLNQSEIINAYVASDCLVLPSDYGETWGLVVNEAMVCGLPAIVSDRVGCSLDLVRDNETGLIFPFGNIDALAQKMVFMACKKKCHDMGTYAQQNVLKHYSVEKAVQGALAAIRKAISNHH